MVIRTKIDSIRPIGRNTQGVRLIKVDDGDTVSSLAKLPREELAEADVVDGAPAILDDGPLAGPDGDGPLHRPHIIDDGVADAEASDHIDDEETPGA
jgi:DNA gyrase subunit A